MRNRSRGNMLNFGRFSSLRGAKRRSNLYLRAFEIATAFEKGLAMTQKCNLYPLNGYENAYTLLIPITVKDCR